MMKKFLPPFAVSAVLAAWTAAPVDAQICNGAASFRNAPIQLGMGIGISRDARAFGGSVAGGSDALFVGGSLSGQTIDKTDGTALTVAGLVGSDRGLDRDHRVHLCPLGGLAYTSGPKVGGLNASVFDVSVGAAVGLIAAKTPAVEIVPTIGVAAHRERFSVSSGPVSVNESQTFGLANLGVGFVFHDQLALVPSVAVPFGLKGGNATFLLGLSYNIRTR